MDRERHDQRDELCTVPTWINRQLESHARQDAETASGVVPVIELQCPHWIRAYVRAHNGLENGKSRPLSKE